MKKISYFCGVIICDGNGNILIVPYINSYMGNRREVRLPGGTSKPEAGDKTVIDTLTREMIEETGLKPLSAESAELVHEFTVPDGTHIKKFFLVRETKGELIKFNGLNKVDNETEAPAWMPARELVKVIYSGHREPLRKALQRLCEESREFALMFCNLV